MSKTPTKFSNGDVVCHKRTFLRSIDWRTNVPKNGIIVDANEEDAAKSFYLVSVRWCDRDNVQSILANNIIHYDKRHTERR